MVSNIEKIKSEIENCAECPFLFEPINRGKKELMWGEGKEILIIGQSPSISDVEKKEGSEFDKFLKSLFDEAGINFNSARFTNFCKASIPPGGSLTQSEFEHCSEHLLDEVIAVEPTMIITLGRLGKQWAGNKFREGSIGIFEEEGRIIQVPIFSLVHPGTIKHQRIEKEEFIRQLKEAYNYGKSKSK